jgi:hypothetical protein
LLQLELDVTVCKSYNYMLKAVKTEPYYVANYEGKFTSKCDEVLLSQQQAAAAAAASKASTRCLSYQKLQIFVYKYM